MAREAIFIGYRREDTADVAGRIYDALSGRFGRARIFKDVDNIRPGADFGNHIRAMLPRCRVVLILIGPNWVNAADEQGNRRLDDPHDWVRIEIELALHNPGLDVVPVLVNGARMPQAEELPPSLHPLLRRHAAIIRRDPDFHDDVGRLATALRASVKSGVLDLVSLGGERKQAAAERGGSPAPWILLGALALAGAAYAAWRYWPSPTPEQVSVETPALGHPLAAEGGEPFRDCPECPEMANIPAGGFIMGAPESEPGRGSDEGPQRTVSVRAFAVGKYEVTRGQWAAFVNATNRPDPQVTGNTDCTWRSPGFAQQDDHPVVCVNHEDALAYAAWLTQRTGQRYRLLSEAEWEYAARGGDAAGPYWWGASASGDHANYSNGGGRDQWAGTSPVGSFPANPFGLHDMHGNVWEWAQDCYASYVGLPTDGSANETPCSARVYRGGSWGSSPQALRSAKRFGYSPTSRFNDLGFRVARTG